MTENSEKNLQESIAYSMEFDENPEIFFCLPYLLQDLWELGTSPEDVMKLIKKYNICKPGARMLDLGCGKGAVSIRVAKELGLEAHGIDGMPEFIAEAKKYAEKYGADHLCSFETGDIRDAVHKMRGFDVAILGAVGYVFGDLEKTITNIKPCLKPGGYLILDDWYVKETIDPDRDDILSRSEFLQKIEAAGASFIDEIIMEADAMSSSNAAIYAKIESRGFELMKTYPDRKMAIEAYLATQRKENELLQTAVVCGTFLIQL